MNLNIPRGLKLGDTVGLVSPSAGLAPFTKHRIDKAIETLEKIGLKVKLSKNSMKNTGYVSESAQKRADDINSMFSDKSIAMIMSTIGGNHSNQILRYLDFDLIKKNPKIFIGYSDITVLHYALYTQGNLASYYGPAAMTQFGEHPFILNYTLDNFKEVFMNNNSGSKTMVIKPSKLWTDETLDWFSKKDTQRARKLKRNNGFVWLKNGKCQGKLVGGAIPSINHLAGTKYWIEPSEKVFFIDIPEGHNFDEMLAISDIDTFFADLDNLGLFEKITGLIIGRLFKCSKENEEQFKKIVLKYTVDKKYPILFNVDIGHSDPMITLRYDSRVGLNSETNELTMEI